MSNTTVTHTIVSRSTEHTTPEGACRARAQAFLTEIIGEEPKDLTWDGTHCLQGHVHVGRREFVVIASRDASHAPVVFDAPTWDAVRRSTTEQRRHLIDSCAITDHARLVSVLASDELAMFASSVAVAA